MSSTSSPARHFFGLKLTTRQLLTIGSVVLLLGAASWAAIAAARKSRQEPERKPPVAALPVQAVAIERVRSFRQRRVFTGVLKAKRSSELGFERTGRLVSVLVTEGDRVSKNQELARLDAANLKARRGELTAQRQAAQSLLEELISGPRKQTIAAAAAEVRDLGAQVELARLSSRRHRQLIETGAVSKEEYDASTLGYKSAEARRDAAQRRLEELKAGTRAERISAQRAAVAQLDAALVNVGVDIEESTLRAPFSGTIARRYFDEGSIVAPGSALLRIVEDTRLEAWIGLPAALAGKLTKGDEVSLKIAERVHQAEVEAVLPELDSTTRTRRAIFRLKAGALAVPAQVVRVELDDPQKVDGFWVPTSGLTRASRGLWSVLVVEGDESDSRASRRDVEVLHTDGSRVMVRGTLESGDRVIVDGTHRIVAGQRVRLGHPRVAEIR